MTEERCPPPSLALWGGTECTVNRVGDRYFDQLARSGHDVREGDLDRFAEIGLRTLRYPLLWERIAPNGLDKADWTWADARMARLRELGIRPIVGLLHHGSGPRGTNLLDPGLPEKLAAFARAVAERYPWVDMYTPVNEPLTTARFSGLYGHWYPHARNGRSFARALLNECRGVALAMRAIREVNPRAALVQTEDLGEARSTRLLAYQARFENHRRWLTFDLLEGRVDRDHPMWSYLKQVGAKEADILALREEPCPPDIIGINYYVTSERFLDHKLERYPACSHGGNGRHRYADVEAVRVCPDGLIGARALINKAWKRYRRPIAITEAHLGCSPDEQVRWLAEIWSEAQGAREDGADVRAVTSWALLGSYDWHTLMTREEGCYEPGAFDVSGGTPVQTPVAELITELAAGREPSHPALATPGWWKRPDRLLYPPVCSRIEVHRDEFEPRLVRGAVGL
jgi:dTDP-4-dehydrorhamnose reductase